MDSPNSPNTHPDTTSNAAVGFPQSYGVPQRRPLSLLLTGSAHPPTLFLARTFDRRWAGLPSSVTSHPLTIDDPSKPAYNAIFTRPQQPCTLHSAALFAILNPRAWMPSLPRLIQSQEPGFPSSGGPPQPERGTLLCVTSRPHFSKLAELCTPPAPPAAPAALAPAQPALAALAPTKFSMALLLPSNFTARKRLARQ
ncbi:hypothetical protein CSAL01_06209 [Colletotrichum salicis]|uniref:Uncharacterized protein n=1 Tax=Colletotrichum salicis TaxID=1209931 RepID=A0A135UT32_9PEZI|nr:hypothetical protein CSAL01_06209 [Colletotrichum salicis]